ncbi:unnamed protein product [Orchesella dallaii]|uniref:Gustatory receptor n=1 Tax=Orchesella dallaii TaxID=48710 RepID=A0ABP1QK28_9HEXA
MEKHHDIFLVHRKIDKTNLEPIPAGYFEYFFTSFDFFVLVPFRLRRSNYNLITYKKNVLHQFLCAVLLFASLVCNGPIFLEAITANVYDDPIRVFSVELKTVQLLNSFVFFNVCWRKTEELIYFANLSSSNFLCGNEQKIVYAFISLYPLLLDLVLIDQFWSYVSFPDEDHWYMYVYEIATQTIGFLGSILLTNFLDTYITVLALSGYNIVRKSVGSLEQLKRLDVARKQWKHGDFSCLIDIAERLQHFFATLNSLGSSIILNWFCMCVPWVSRKLVDSMPGTGADLVGESMLTSLTKINKNVIGQMYYWSFIGLYLVIMIICAEIRKECENIKRESKRIILKYDPELTMGKAALFTIQHALENVGINGGFFFNFSYSFLGSTAGLVVAYSFLALQLRLNCCSSTNMRIGEVLKVQNNTYVQ